MPKNPRPLPRHAGSGKRHGCVPYGRGAALAMALTFGWLTRVLPVQYTGELSVLEQRTSGDPFSFCGGVSCQCSPRRQALWAPASWPAALTRDWNTRGEHRPIGRAQPDPPTAAVAGGSLGFGKRQGLVLQREFTPAGWLVRCGACDVKDTPHDFSVGGRSECQAPTACQTRGGAGQSPTPSPPGVTSPLGLFFNRRLMRTTKKCARMINVI